MTDRFTSGYRLDRERRDLLRQSAIDFRAHVDGRYCAPEEIDPRPWH